MALLEIERLEIGFGGLAAVRGASFAVDKGETHCLVGESGCGKSVTALAVMGLLAPTATRKAAGLRFDGQDLSGLSEREMSRLRGDRMAMIFQEPMTSLNPAYTVGSQMAEVLIRHRGGSKKAALDRAAELLERVRITSPGMRLGQYPHQLSGGLRQRVMIAMALMCGPELLIADEPTTALDVTVQAQILQLLAEIRQDFGTAVILITHDLGIVAGFCDRTLVMYGGQIMEEGPTEAVFARPLHPYTAGLLSAVPRIDREEGMLRTIAGEPPDMSRLPAGCPFSPRCGIVTAVCAGTRPDLVACGPGRRRACHAAAEEVV